jgi:hypothetical protein
MLSHKLGKENAEHLTLYVENKIKEDLESKTQMLATKEDLSKLDLKFIDKINSVKVDLIKWMFAFWVTVVLMMIGLYFKK